LVELTVTAFVGTAIAQIAAWIAASRISVSKSWPPF